MKKLTSEEFIKRSKIKHRNRYDYTNTVYKDYNTKIKIICKIHGEFEQLPAPHLRGSGCQKCAGNNKTSLKKFIEKAVQVHGEFYDYSKVEYKNALTKIKITCPIHGEFEQIPNKHINSKQGCPQCCHNYKTTKNIFIQRAKKIHKNLYDYSLVDYKGVDNPVKIICQEHGEFEQTPYKHTTRKQGCPICNSSKGEKYIAFLLDFFNIKYEREKTFDDLFGCNNGLLRFDFFLSEYNICIEYDGEQHFRLNGLLNEDQFDYLKTHDDLKNKYCKDNNIKIFRISYKKFNSLENLALNVDEIKIKSFMKLMYDL